MSQAETIVGLGARADYVAQAPNADPGRLRFTSDEAAMFAAVGRAMRIEDLIAASGLAEARAIAVLLALRAKGAIVPAKVSMPTGPTAPLDAAMAETVDLDPERKREILDFERVVEKLNHFDVLGLRPGATLEETKKAFYEASRRYHPDRFFNKHLGSFRSRVEKIFKRVSEANNVLSNPERRAAYLKAHPELAAPPPVAAPRDDVRDQERRQRFARHPYFAKANRLSELVGRAKDHLAHGDFGLAYTDLNIAAQIEPANQEVQTLLQDARKKHEYVRAEQELKKGAEAEKLGDFAAASAAYKTAVNIDTSNARASYRAALMMHKMGVDAKEIRVHAQRAADLEPNNADYQVLISLVLNDLGMKKMAKKHLDEALKINPEHAEAKKHAKKTRWPF